jgi:RNA polymerase sigma-70 factor (ECF subfamily)
MNDFMTRETIEVADQHPSEGWLVERAITGDQAALERLLLTQYDQLERHIRLKLPQRLQSVQAVEDILQLSFMHAFRHIGRFQPRSDASFTDWLTRIADNRLMDAIREHDRQKRGGEMQRVEDRAADESRLVDLWQSLAAEEATASSMAARGEAIHALQVALAALPPDQHDAIRLHLLEGKSLEETAATMKRTPDAIRGLVFRGKQALHEALGRASRWLKTK